MPSSAALEIAGQCWCDDATKNIVMDSDLANAFAERLDICLEALMWCGGSEDFQIGGKARIGWERSVRPILQGSVHVVRGFSENEGIVQTRRPQKLPKEVAEAIKRGADEIRSLRRANDLLQAKLDGVEMMAGAVFAQPPTHVNRGYGDDEAWKLENILTENELRGHSADVTSEGPADG